MNQPISSRLWQVVEAARRFNLNSSEDVQGKALLDLREQLQALDQEQLHMVNVILAESETLPPITALAYEYVMGADGLYIRAEDSRLCACIPIADVPLSGFADVEPSVEWKLPRIPESHLIAILESARRHFPNEAIYQLVWGQTQNGTPAWRITMPKSTATPSSLSFADESQAAMDLHSHGGLEAFFSSTDDEDEQGFRAYVVIGKVKAEIPQIICRVGVYGHHWIIPSETLFEGLGPFSEVLTKPVDAFDEEEETEMQDEITQSEREGKLVVARFGEGA